MNRFKEISPEAIDENFIRLIARQWMLVTAGDAGKCNTMTASWGGAGHLWNRNVVFVFIRPQRYTKSLVDSHHTLTLSFLPEEMRPALVYCGSHSGRDEDKIKNAGLSVWFTPGGTPAIAEAKLVLECRKIYKTPLESGPFVEKDIAKEMYPENDFHEMYVCEIEKTYVK